VLNDPAAISVTATTNNITCHGACNGSVSLVVSGGTMPYIYAWGNGATTQNLSNLCAWPGGLTLSILDTNNCPYDDLYYITEPDTLTLDAASQIGGTFLYCHGDKGGSIFADVQGGTTPYAYLWSTGGTGQLVENLGAGNYVITVTDTNGCIVKDSLEFTQPAAFHLTYSTSDYNGYNISCNGTGDGSICVSITGQVLPYTYYWSTGGTDSCNTGLSAGQHCLSVLDANYCELDSCFTLTEPDLLTDSYTYTDPTCPGCADGTIALTPYGGLPPYTYTWSPNTSSTDSSETSLLADTYSVCATDMNGCSVCEIIALSDPLSARNLAANLSATIFPNPSNGKFNLVFPSAMHDARIEIIDPVGKLFFSEIYSGTAGSKKEMNLDAPAGIYFVQITSDRSRWMGKIIKE